MTTGTKQQRTRNPEFEVHRLNQRGLENADSIATWFDTVLEEIKGIVPEGRQLSLVKTHLEQACFYAKKGMAQQSANQE